MIAIAEYGLSVDNPVCKIYFLGIFVGSDDAKPSAT
jgi:hypothetical protein